MSRKKKKSPIPPHETSGAAQSEPLSRRRFLKTATATGAAAALSVNPLLANGARTAAAKAPVAPVRGDAPPPGTYAPMSVEQIVQRRRAAYALREERARHWLHLESKMPLANDDELLYPDGWANFSKSLLHDSLGHPSPSAFKALVKACRTGKPEDFNAIPLGGTQPLRNPQGGYSFEYCGPDSNQTWVPPAPPFASAWRAAEMVEVYWAALLRDVPFTQWSTHPEVAQACADLSALSDYRGPKKNGMVTPETIFRGPYAGCDVGPFLSQFLLQDLAFGAQVNSQQVKTFLPNTDYLTGFGEWLARQNGAAWGPRPYDPVLRYLRSLRDLAAWVDADPPLQAAYHALSILLQMGCPLDPGSPYVSAITNQDAFTTFGPVEWFDLVGRAPRPAHEAVWFLKWRIHRTLRPEEFAGRVHNHIHGSFSYPIHPDVLNSQAVPKTFSKQGTYLCSSAYPDAAPTHTSYPSGHSTGAGSTVAMLKAIFDESFVIPNPVQPSADGLSLVPYVGPPLTVGGELNKLAFNIGMGRIAGGIHWRSDVAEGNALGEAVSLGILADMEPACNEKPFSGFSLTKFDGTTITT
jgi:membrane-associated phospholipid phosphatase